MVLQYDKTAVMQCTATVGLTPLEATIYLPTAWKTKECPAIILEAAESQFNCNGSLPLFERRQNVSKDAAAFFYPNEQWKSLETIFVHKNCIRRCF